MIGKKTIKEMEKRYKLLILSVIIPFLGMTQKPSVDITNLLFEKVDLEQAYSIKYKCDLPWDFLLDGRIFSLKPKLTDFEIVVEECKSLKRQRNKVLLSLYDNEKNLLIQYDMIVKVNCKGKAKVKDSLALVIMD